MASYGPGNTIAIIVLNPQDINKFRFELVDILSKNNFDIGKVRTGDGCYGGRRAKQMERRIMKVIKLYYFHKPFFISFVEINLIFVHRVSTSTFKD